MINEKKLIEDLKNTFSDSVLNQTFGFGKYTLLEAVEEMINRQPQVETDTNVGSKWIPCEERLPEINKKVLVTIWCHRVEKGFLSHTGKWFVITEDGIDEATVIAWQPFPQSYRKEGAER